MIYTINDTCINTTYRCGHISMLEYFGLERNDKALLIGLQHSHLFVNSPAKQLVIVLRNPYDRLLSAIRNTKIHEENQLKQNPASAKLKYQFTLPSFCHDYTINHSRPYLTVAVPDRWDGNPYIPTNLKHIDFHRLSEYIPVGVNTVATNTNLNTYEKRVDAMLSYKFSDYFNEEYLLSEHERYVDLMENTEELSVEDWLKVK